MHTLGVVVIFSAMLSFIIAMTRKEEERFAIPDSPLDEPCSSCKGMVVHRIYGAYYQYEDDYCMRCGKTTNFKEI